MRARRSPLRAGGGPEPPNIGEGEAEGNGGGPAIPGIGPSIPGSTGDQMVSQPPHVETPHARLTRMSEGVMAAMLVHRVEPMYPPLARAMHLSGTVHLRAIIGKDGTVRELELLDGNRLLAQAAMAAVHDWRYQSTRLNGEPVEVETYITVNFVLN